MSAARSDPPRVLALWCPGWRENDAAAPAPRLFEQVVAAVEEFCPQVEVLRPGECVIGARGPTRYFGGEEPLARKIMAAVTGLGFACQAGVADGVFAAGLAARDGVIVPPGQTRAFLARQPVSTLGDPVLEGLLPRLGIRTLGEFAALPPADAASRFGAAGALAHRLARGQQARPAAAPRPAEDLSVRHEFDPPADLAEPVVFAAKALAERMHAGLAGRGLACARMQVTVSCADGREITRLWRHDGLLSAQAVAERVHWQLDGWSPGGDGNSGEPGPVGGVCLLQLVPDQLARDQGRQLGLWGEALVSDRVSRAAIRVQAMLGHTALLRPLLSGGRDPAEQVTLIPFGEPGSPDFPPGRPWPGRIPAPAPATVYPAPLPAAVTDQAGAPVTVTGRAQISAAPARLAVDGRPPVTVTAWAGPWPVTPRWWHPGRAARKARFQLVTGDGSAWLAVVQDGRWLIEASYDLIPGSQEEMTAWDGTTRRCRGGNSSSACRGAASIRRPQARPARRRRSPAGGRSWPARRGCSAMRRAAGRNCTVTPATASSTARPLRPSWWPRPPGRNSPRWPSPTMTACTVWLSSRRPLPG